ncbi:helix-turn-helix transcriptional regulator [Butyricicoccus faecihominis]|uniref:helix-turn-helix domain-containing protein n=1 Tax=Butyricicoccaceae TaxID=3085642 RepID=UPI0024786FFE|nr:MULTISPECIES: helix-turn-helix transcriptional regulator [Butyricicoccaceae]MCQ5130583.1 helix-turn-helix transcriptional regulator [Butyricicoccus faecihominis]WNX83938.1 helix-turn-helix transcriptional regulator [Agathobaculum sp. NTUH-O15-33]
MDFRHSDKYRKLGLNIAYYRKDNGFTQDNLAEKINVSRNSIGKIETASVGISMDMLFDIAEALDIPAYKLLEFRD